MRGLKYQLPVQRKWLLQKAVSPMDAERLCRLKELAESNKDHRKALQFHADEMRAKRWHQHSFFSNLLDFMFDKLSNYGQSIVRPFICLILTVLTMTLYSVGYQFPVSSNPQDYVIWFKKTQSISFETWIMGLELSLSHTIPFIGGIIIHGRNALVELGHMLPEHYGAITVLFSLPAFIFLFLISLGLRNRFRL